MASSVRSSKSIKSGLLVLFQLVSPNLGGLPRSNQGSLVLIIIEAQVGTGLACRRQSGHVEVTGLSANSWNGISPYGDGGQNLTISNVVSVTAEPGTFASW
jgi:hypothetical protein